jgi:hypothetical protein
MYDNAHAQRVHGRLFEFSGANLSSGRNKLVKRFLEDPAAEWLWMVDADMVFPPDTLDALMSNASKDRAPIVGGLCFGINDGLLFPTMYAFQPDKDTGEPVFCRINGFETGVMMPVHATGAACLLIHRSVLEAVRDKQFNSAFPWFQETQIGDAPCGEDITFCLRAGQLGFPVHVDTGVDIGHHKDHLLNLELFNKQKDGESLEPAYAG